MIKDWKKDVFTIPNFLSAFRLVLIPFYLSLYLNAQSTKDYVIAAVILAVSCLTDLLDGLIARKYNMVSSIGKILDPVADKMTQFSLLVALMLKYVELRYLAFLFVIKEGFQFVAGILLLRQRRILKGAHMAGKISTTVLFISLFIMMLFQDLPHSLVVGIVCIDFILLMMSFIQYIRIFAGKADQIVDL